MKMFLFFSRRQQKFHGRHKKKKNRAGRASGNTSIFRPYVKVKLKISKSEYNKRPNMFR